VDLIGGMPAKKLPDDNEADFVMGQLRAIAGEHFDHGIVMVCREVNGATEYFHTAIGNQFAIKGMIEAYIDGEFEPEIEIEFEDDEDN
jgi:hypothetical protein